MSFEYAPDAFRDFVAVIVCFGATLGMSRDGWRAKE
jgi:hypothetical protein